MSTTSGEVFGGQVKGPDGTNTAARAFLGIPFGKSKRWQKPEPVAKAEKPIYAVGFGPPCPQQCAGGGVEGSEDCLSINVWAPSPFKADKKYPVMVYIYGGAFIEGASNAFDTWGPKDKKPSPGNLFYGTYISSKHNVIVVSFNYRLGVLGFLAPFDLPAAASGGNYGFLDQQLALQWVQDNIENFGGDKTKVTIFGESAGAISVALHMLSAESSYDGNLFRAGIMESNLPGLPLKRIYEAQADSLAWARKAVACNDMACLEAKTCEELVSKGKLRGTSADALDEFLEWTPNLDTELITNDPIDGKFKQPAMMGTNLNEGILFSYQLMEAVKAVGLGATVYNGLVKTLFPNKYSAILDKDDYAPETCGNPFTRKTCYLANGKKLAAMITDYLFTCGNQELLDRQSAQDDLFLYNFQQFADRYTARPPENGCPPDEKSGAEWLYCSCFDKGGKHGDETAVCHGAELPFVFNSEALAKYGSAKSLGPIMADFWAQFATNLDPGAAWPSYSSDEAYQLFKDGKASKTTVGGNNNPNPFKNCEFWSKQVGYPSY